MISVSVLDIPVSRICRALGSSHGGHKIIASSEASSKSTIALSIELAWSHPTTAQQDLPIQTLTPLRRCLNLVGYERSMKDGWISLDLVVEYSLFGVLNEPRFSEKQLFCGKKG